MRKFTFAVTVETDTLDHAHQVMSERLNYDEMYEDEHGEKFDYWFGETRLIERNEDIS